LYRSRRLSALDDATRRLAAIHAEIASILAMFPELRYIATRTERRRGARAIRRVPVKTRHLLN
jgi:hypothetical protein